MINPTAEQLKLFNDEITAFFIEVEEKKKRVQNDLQSLKLPLLNRKICDFGCGLGYTTYSLASILNATESIGIDIDPVVVRKANLWIKAIKLHMQLTAKDTLSDFATTQKANQTLGILSPPKFLTKDVISGKKLPSKIGLAYCRKLLVNIIAGNYENKISGIDGCKLAIQNIAKTIISGGWFIAVEEKQGGDFSPLLEEYGLSCVAKTDFQLGGALPYVRYLYKKP